MNYEGSVRVLLIEDNPGDARLVREALIDAEHTKFSLTQVSSIATAHTAFDQGSFEIVLLDLGLPDASGIDAVTEVQRLAPRLPILVLTGNDDDEMALQALQAGAQDYLVKDEISAAGLARTIRYVLGRYRILTQRLELISTFAGTLRGALDELQLAAEALDPSPSEAALVPGRAVATMVGELIAFRLALAQTARSESGVLPLELRGLNASALIAAIKSPSTLAAAAAAALAASRHLDVLLVEDNPGDARLVVEAFSESRKLDVALVEAVSISQGIVHLQQKPFDAVLLDLGLPDAKGLEAVYEVHRTFPNVAIVVRTGMDDDALALGALGRGAQDYLVKGRNDDPRNLERSLRYAVERQRSANFCVELLEALACELRLPLHVILGNLCVLRAMGSEGGAPAAIDKVIELACALLLFSDTAVAVARSGQLRDPETAVVTAIADLRRAVVSRPAAASEMAAHVLRDADLLRANGGRSGGLLNRLGVKRRKRALLLDPNEHSRALTRRVLEGAGYEVVESSAQPEAAERLVRDGVDVAVVDVDGDGEAVELRRVGVSRRVPMVFVRNRPLENDTTRRNPGEHTLARPFGPQQLLFAVSHLKR